MLELTPHTVGHIRSLFSAGLYHKSEIYLRFHLYFTSPQEFLDILNYTTYPDIRPDLSNRIISLSFVFDLVEEYRQQLRDHVVADVPEEATDFLKCKQQTDNSIEAKIKFINKEFQTDYTLYDIQGRLYKDI